VKLSVALPRRLGSIEVNFQPQLNAVFWFFGIRAHAGTTEWYIQGSLLLAVVILGKYTTWIKER